MPNNYYISNKQLSHLIACVVITYNNIDNIEKLLKSLISQSRFIKEIILIDNGSSDGTAQLVKELFPNVTLFINPSNIGVGGGYNQGLKYAYLKDYKWIWLLDGDSLPQFNAMEELMKALKDLTSVYSNIGILASVPINPSTSQIYGGFIRNGLFHKIPKEIMEFKKPVSVDTVISSGCLVSDKVIEKVGLPRTDFFMDFVDAEYNLRIRKNGFKIISVPTSIIYHKVGNIRIIKSRITKTLIRICLAKKGELSFHSPWREYYAKRNEMYTFWHEFRSYKDVFRLILSSLVDIFYIIIFDDEKIKRINYIRYGLADGFKGVTGKTVTPSP